MTWCCLGFHFFFSFYGFYLGDCTLEGRRVSSFQKEDGNKRHPLKAEFVLTGVFDGSGDGNKCFPRMHLCKHSADF